MARDRLLARGVEHLSRMVALSDVPRTRIRIAFAYALQTFYRLAPRGSSYDDIERAFDQVLPDLSKVVLLFLAGTRDTVTEFWSEYAGDDRKLD